MAATFGEGQSVHTHFCQWLVSISLHSTSASNIQPKISAPRSYHVRSTDSVYFSCRTSEQLLCFSKEVRRRLASSSGTYETLKSVAVIFTRVWLSLLNWRFFVELCLVLYHRALVLNSLSWILLFLVYSLVSTLGFVPYSVFIFSIFRVF